MSAAAAPARDVIARCSFCEKSNNDVAKMIAGPGVYICNECVDLCATIIADPATTTREEPMPRSKYFDRPAEEILTSLPALARSAGRVEATLAAWVGRLRELGTDWAAIAGALELSVEAARQRFENQPPAEGSS